MDNTKYRLGWVIFSLFVWFHLAQNILPLPSQRAADIEMQASEAVENSNALAEKGVERDEHMQMLKEEWEAELTASYWSIWIINFLFFLFGLVSTFFLYKNLKIWPVFLGTVSVLCFVYFLLSYVRLESPFIEWKNFMRFTLERENRGSSLVLNVFSAILIPHGPSLTHRIRWRLVPCDEPWCRP